MGQNHKINNDYKSALVPLKEKSFTGSLSTELYCTSNKKSHCLSYKQEQHRVWKEPGRNGSKNNRLLWGLQVDESHQVLNNKLKKVKINLGHTRTESYQILSKNSLYRVQNKKRVTEYWVLHIKEQSYIGYYTR